MHAIDTRSLVDRICEHLLNQIIKGAIKYGEVLSVKKLAAELSVSTMPVREALKRLEFDHIVNVKPRSKHEVARPSRKMILEAYELRELLEAYAVEKSGGKIAPDAMKKLHSIVGRMKDIDALEDMADKEQKAIELDRQFHLEICRLAKNDFMEDFHRQLSLHVNMTLIHEKTYHKLEKQWAESHSEIVRCLENEYPKTVAVLKKHFSNVKDILTRNGLGDQSEGEVQGELPLSAERESAK